jgi:hypothetical protein
MAKKKRDAHHDRDESIGSEYRLFIEDLLDRWDAQQSPLRSPDPERAARFVLGHLRYETENEEKIDAAAQHVVEVKRLLRETTERISQHRAPWQIPVFKKEGVDFLRRAVLDLARRALVDALDDARSTWFHLAVPREHSEAPKPNEIEQTLSECLVRRFAIDTDAAALVESAAREFFPVAEQPEDSDDEQHEAARDEDFDSNEQSEDEEQADRDSFALNGPIARCLDAWVVARAAEGKPVDCEKAADANDAAQFVYQRVKSEREIQEKVEVSIRAGIAAIDTLKSIVQSTTEQKGESIREQVLDLARGILFEVMDESEQSLFLVPHIADVKPFLDRSPMSDRVSVAPAPERRRPKEIAKSIAICLMRDHGFEPAVAAVGITDAATAVFDDDAEHYKISHSSLRRLAARLDTSSE